MSGLGPLVGFALVFVVTAWTVSAVLFVLIGAAAGRLRQVGPAAERKVTSLAAALPLLIASTVVATLLVRSVIGADHCPVHDHHAHFCLAHGETWAARPWAVALVAAAGAMALTRLALLGGALLRGRRAVARLRAASTRVADVRLVESPQPFCFVAGLGRPEIYASTAAWQGLPPDERDAMLAHERGHVRHRDLVWRALLEAVAALGAPLTPAPLLARWAHATERLRDADAAETIGSPEAVAGALVHMCRLGAQPMNPSLVGFTGTPAALDDRVEALLAGSPRGDRAAMWLGRAVLLLVAVIAVSVASHAEPLHHALESLLG